MENLWYHGQILSLKKRIKTNFNRLHFGAGLVTACVLIVVHTLGIVSVFNYLSIDLNWKNRFDGDVVNEFDKGSATHTVVKNPEVNNTFIKGPIMIYGQGGPGGKGRETPKIF